MSDGLGLLTGDSGDSEPPRQPGSRRKNPEPEKKKSGFGKLLAAIVVLLAFVAAAWFAYQFVTDKFSGPEDYEGAGSGEVSVKIEAGANGSDIAKVLADNDVVASSQAFYDLSLSDPRAASIQPGTYTMAKKMSAKAAMDFLSNPANLSQAKVTIPEGARVGQIAKRIGDNTHISVEEVEALFDDPEKIGLPDAANGNPEGYLYPETYFVDPDTTAQQLLSRMVKQTMKTATDLDIGERARALGLTGPEVLTVASILEYEGKRDEDYPKIARVLYNRLEQGMPLQLDSTVSYVSQREGDVWTTPEERANPSEYNTYQHKGLPPGPIGSPGAKTIEAALNPADGDWLYFLAIDLETGETAFNKTFEGHVADCRKAFGANACAG